ncbi:MAG: hypothetical protein RTU92_04940 [Candidatus Thorarchaeota archaeon]
MSEEIEFKKLILYLTGVALALFYLLYAPWTAMSALVTGGWVWVYYFSLVLGLLFPLYYAIGKENMAWYVLGLSFIVNGLIMVIDGAAWAVTPALWLMPGVMILLLGVFFFLGPILEKMMPDNWDLIKNLFHILKGLFIILAVGFYTGNWNLDSFIGVTSFNHAMPQFLFLGGGIFVAFGVIIFMYGLLKLLSGFLPENIGGYFTELGKIFYIFMVLVFLLGITFNVVYYAGIAFWGAGYLAYPAIVFFAGFAGIGAGNLGAILLIILYIYGMMRIAKKLEDEPAAADPY